MPFGIFPQASLNMSFIYDAKFKNCKNCHCRLLRHVHHNRGGIGYQPVLFKLKNPTIKANKPLHNLRYCGTKVALICGL